ncbi:glycosyl transferase family 4 [Prauserella shujinwangii]|uniref:Glycosyl transferase family 4 n=1 Tax=Prauserella shujinwangii TaxID=1453103 RepID=A0A2T0LV92_9PSEU|nr:glycosyltransferase [Prauserella shujinwangii]PRX47762.1 glycosyl transferase family 4 [Prauserella shujinwangii]
MADGERAARILCISFSEINRDARVLRQLDILAELGDVTTIGYGAKPSAAAEHLELDDALYSLPQTPAGVAALALHTFDRAEFMAPAVRAARRLLEGREFDVVVANEARAMALGYHVAKGAPVVADMHEWAPEERTHVLSWRLLVKPFMVHQCAKYLPKMSAVTVVNDSIGELYRERFGVGPRTVRNASAYQKLEPSEVRDGRIRLVHSGGAIPGRNLEALIESVRGLDEKFTLDLYLVPGRDGGRYLDSLRALIADEPRITLHPPVRPDELAATLNQYDVGVFSLPPLTPNHRFMLPNKIFDFVQARLAVVFGSAPETDRLITEHGLGAIAPDASAQAMRDTLAGLDEEQVRKFKQNTHEAAAVLNSAEDCAVIRSVVSDLLRG